MEQLTGEILLQVLFRTDARICARAAAVNRFLRQVAGEEVLWKEFCARDFALLEPTDCCGRKCGSYKEAYALWEKTFFRYPKVLVARTVRCWDAIKTWLGGNFKEVLDSLAPGASWEEIEAAEQDLGFALPDSLRLLYQISNGQKIPTDGDSTNDRYVVADSFLGLFGGYYVYEHFVNVHMLSLKYMVSYTKNVLQRLGRNIRRVVIARSYNSPKFFFLDCNDGGVYVATRILAEEGMMPCVPLNQAGAHPKDGLIRWLENYGSCLQSGMFGVRNDDYRSICIFPRKGPYCTEAVTHGLQVKSSAVFVPEMSRNRTEGGEDNYIFAYSVRMRLLDTGNIYRGRLMESAQLIKRHWVIRSNNEVKYDFHGDAVIGKYPRLQAGGDEFVYESRSAQEGKVGSMEGDFTFVPGSIAKQEGEKFDAVIARFPLEVPDFIY